MIIVSFTIVDGPSERDPKESRCSVDSHITGSNRTRMEVESLRIILESVHAGFEQSAPKLANVSEVLSKLTIPAQGA